VLTISKENTSKAVAVFSRFNIPAIVIDREDGKVFFNSASQELFQIDESFSFEDFRLVSAAPNSLKDFILRIGTGEIAQTHGMEWISLALQGIDKSYPVVYSAWQDDPNIIAVQVLSDSVYETLPAGGEDANFLVLERTAELYELNNFLTSIVDSSTETFIIAIGNDGRILSFNEGASQIFEYAKTEVVGRENIEKLFAQKEREEGKYEEMKKIAAEMGKCRQMANLHTRSGRTFPALIDLTPLRNDQHQELGMLFVGRDMTETLTIQRALEQRTRELEFINSLSLEIGQTLEVDQVAQKTLRKTVEMFDGIAGAIYLESDDADDEGLPQLIAVEPPSFSPNLAGKLFLNENDFDRLRDRLPLLRTSADAKSAVMMGFEHKPLYLCATPVTSKAQLMGALVILRHEPFDQSKEFAQFLSALGLTVGSALDNAFLYKDTVLKKEEITLRNQELDEFAYIVSHDLKEPLAGISFIATLLVQDYYENIDEQGQTYINSLMDFSKRLDELIDALLDLSRIGRIKHPSEKVNIGNVIKEVKQNLSYSIETKNVDIIAPEEDLFVWGDRIRIVQVFNNLISNAIKFNDKDHPVVEISAQKLDENMYQFSVRDNGIGIESEYFDKIFKIFERLNAREDYEGTGAGLTIVKKIVETHGGMIWLESILDEGTTFYFTLPRYISSETDQSNN